MFPANLEYAIEAWKKTVDVQQHFNEYLHEDQKLRDLR